jgi:hypothetical protein
MHKRHGNHEGRGAMKKEEDISFGGINDSPGIPGEVVAACLNPYVSTKVGGMINN